MFNLTPPRELQTRANLPCVGRHYHEKLSKVTSHKEWENLLEVPRKGQGILYSRKRVPLSHVGVLPFFVSFFIAKRTGKCRGVSACVKFDT